MTIPDKAVEAALDAWIWTPKSTADIKTAMRAALAAAEQAMWEPIESAKGECLVFQPECPSGRLILGARMLVSNGNPGHHRPSTHWRPLPPPPETKK